MKYLAFIHSVVFSLLIIDDVLMLYTAFDGSELEYAPVSGGSYIYILGPLTLIFWFNFAAPWHKSILSYIQYHYFNEIFRHFMPTVVT
jgi:hypothetical protein